MADRCALPGLTGRIAVFALIACLGACATRTPAPPSSPPPPQATFSEAGQASWYGPSHQGHVTADGESFDMHELTAAHLTLPFGTIVRVTNLSNGRTVKVRINDRGPYVKGRIIDLSKAAADALGMVDDGETKVRLKVYDSDQETASGE